MVLLLVFMQLTRDLFVIAKFLFYISLQVDILNIIYMSLLILLFWAVLYNWAINWMFLSIVDMLCACVFWQSWLWARWQHCQSLWLDLHYRLLWHAAGMWRQCAAGESDTLHYLLDTSRSTEVFLCCKWNLSLRSSLKHRNYHRCCHDNVSD